MWYIPAHQHIRCDERSRARDSSLIGCNDAEHRSVVQARGIRPRQRGSQRQPCRMPAPSGGIVPSHGSGRALLSTRLAPASRNAAYHGPTCLIARAHRNPARPIPEVAASCGCRIVVCVGHDHEVSVIRWGRAASDPDPAPCVVTGSVGASLTLGCWSSACRPRSSCLRMPGAHPSTPPAARQALGHPPPRPLRHPHHGRRM